MIPGTFRREHGYNQLINFYLDSFLRYGDRAHCNASKSRRWQKQFSYLKMKMQPMLYQYNRIERFKKGTSMLPEFLKENKNEILEVAWLLSNPLYSLDTF